MDRSWTKCLSKERKVTKCIAKKYENEEQQENTKCTRTKTTKIYQEIGVSDVSESGPSYRKLRSGDKIINITYDNVTYPVTDLYSIEDVLLRTNLNDTVELYIERDGNYETVRTIEEHSHQYRRF